MALTHPAPPPFTAIFSTAGSRKTTQLTQRAVDHVLAGYAQPEEILLTTLTRSAAAQLHERSVEQSLWALRASGGATLAFLDQCHRLEHAAIGTLHSLGLEVRQRRAILNGLPVRPKVLSGADETDLLQRLIDDLEPGLAERLAEAARRVGRHEPLPRAQSGVAWRADLLDVVELMRRLRLRRLPLVLAAAVSSVNRLNIATPIPRPPATPRSVSKRFARVVARRSVPTYHGETLTQLLSRVKSSSLASSKAGTILSRGFWGGLTQLKRTSDTDLRKLAEHLHTAPCFQQDCLAYVTALGEAAHAIERNYRRHKRRRGLVDFRGLAESLHRHGWHDEVRFIGCDEVQDLTGRQIETIEQLVSAARGPQSAAVWVGDKHQHLFGYQGASWAAADAAVGRLGGGVIAIDTNYRSNPLLVGLFNALFTPARPAQKAGRGPKPGEVTHVERWTLSTSEPGRDDHQDDAALRRRLIMPDETRALAAGIADLLARRPSLGPSDIAVVVRTNLFADHVIQALHELGIPVDASPRSLAETREGRIIVEALRLLADPADLLAAAGVAHLWQDWSAANAPTGWFWEGLRDGIPGSAAISPPPGLADLIADRSHASRLSPAEAVQRVIAALGLIDRAAGWDNAAGRLRNLDGALAIARAYEARCRADGRSPTIAGLAAVFAGDPDSGESPVQTRVATGGVTVTTTHMAKGVGWPVTIVGECGWQPNTGSSTFVIRDYEQVSPAGVVERQPHVLPWAYGTYPVRLKNGRYLRKPYLPHGAKDADLLQGSYGVAASSLAGSKAIAACDRAAEENNVFVAFTRAESILVIACPRPHVPYKKSGKASPTRLDFLQPALDRLLPPRLAVNTPTAIPGVSEPGSLDYTRFKYSVNSAAAAPPSRAAVVSAGSVAAAIANFRLHQYSDPYPIEYPPADGVLPGPEPTYPKRFWKPSDEPPHHTRGIDPNACTGVPLGTDPLAASVAARITAANDALIGDVIHTLFAALPSLAAVSPSDRPAMIEVIAARCIAAGGHHVPLNAADLKDRVIAFEEWLATQGLSLITELPLLVERTAMPATFWRGRLDALGVPGLASSPSAPPCVIDHKSATRASPEWLATWLAETTAYASCLPGATAFEEMVRIHLPLAAALIVARAERS
jgi:superfamily I DNA/RNA helicase